MKIIVEITSPVVYLRAFLIAQLIKKSVSNAWNPGSIPSLGRSAGKGISYPFQYSWTSLVTQLVKNPPVGDLGSIPALGRSPGERKGYPLQYSGLRNSMDCINTVVYLPLVESYWSPKFASEERKNIPKLYLVLPFSDTHMYIFSYFVWLIFK